jgi:hypothetical protein
MTCRFSARLLVACLLSAAGQTYETHAQSNSSDLTQERRSKPDGATGKAETGFVAQVGAGTTSGSTTGDSGPKKQASSGRIELPALPSKRLCEAYREQPAHQSCIAIISRGK